jgi:hypothetical protein
MFCLLTGGILLRFTERKRSSRFLAGFYFSFGYAIVIAGLAYSGLIFYIPHLYRTGNIGWLIGMPLAWLYIRNLVRPRPLSGWDLLHLVPALLYIVDYLPFFSLSASAKAAIFREDIGHIDQLIRYRQGWLLPPNSHVPIRSAQAMLYWFLQVRLLWSGQAAFLRKDQPVFRWLLLFNLLQIAMFLPTLVTLLIGRDDYAWASTVPPILAILLSALALSLRPRILYGVPVQ